MIKLHGLGPVWGLPDPSPFVAKVITLLKMANINYEIGDSGLRNAPKGKIPYLTLDDGTKLGDSALIKEYLIKEKGANFDNNYDAPSLAIGLAFERLCEDHLYWILMHDRWEIDENFDKGARHFYDAVPEEKREQIIAIGREKAKNARISHGIGRHSDDEIFMLGKQDIDALADFIGGKKFLLGDKVCGYDAAVHAVLWGISINYFKSQTGEYVRTKPDLMSYIKGMTELYYPELA